MAREYCAQCGGRAVPEANIHLTLAFLGDVPVARVGELASLADAVAGTPFELTLDSRGYWRHNRIVWVGAMQCPAALRELAVRLTHSLKAGGFRHEAREYVPHITLLRDARRAPTSPAPAPVVWNVEDFTLVRSTPGGQSSAYEILHRWPCANA